MTSDPRQSFEEALRLFKKDKIGEAIQKLESLQAEHPSFEDAFEALAILYEREKRLEDAIATCKKWIRLNPHSIMAHANLSRFYAGKGLIAEAEHEQGEARRLGWIQELKQKKMAMPKVDPQEKIERFKKVITLDPNDVLGYYSLGDAYLENKMIREAREAFEKAVAVDPNHSSSYLGLGTVYQSLGELEKAKDVFEKGVRVADERGDMMTMKKMQARLAQLKNEKPL